MCALPTINGIASMGTRFVQLLSFITITGLVFLALAGIANA